MIMNNQRTSEVSRKTKETKVSAAVNLDGTGRASVETGVGFFDHMLELLAKHSLIDINVHAEGDLDVDDHHTVEDVGIVLGRALEQALGDKRGIQRYGWAIVPMDESLAQVAVDMSGRPAFVFNVSFPAGRVGRFDTELIGEFLKTFANSARMNLHVNVPYGSNSHHIAEAVFKGLAKALRQAVARDPRSDEIPSTKESL